MALARQRGNRAAKERAGTGATERPATALALAGVRPAKSRGQNFLVSRAVAKRIVDAAELGAGDEVIEIGPGLGILTEEIVARPHRRLTLIELDPRLARRLAERFASDAAVRVLNEDFLATSLAAITGRGADLGGHPIKIIGNLPFSAAAAVLRKLSDNARSIARMVLMFQREVAERIRARPGGAAYGALSAFTAMYWKIDLHFIVAAGSFHPRPKVDAEVIGLRPLAQPPFKPEEEIVVLEAVRAAFSAPRKTIRNALAGALGVDAASARAALEKAGIDPGARAETIGVAGFVALARALGPRAGAGRWSSRDA